MLRTRLWVLVTVLVTACSGAGPAASPRVTVTTEVLDLAVSTTAPTTTSADTATSTTPVTTTTPATTTTATTTTIPIGAIDDLALDFTEIASGFVQPVLLVAPLDDPRQFVVDQDGTIWAIDSGDAVVFLDITDEVSFRGEQGLLGLAFHPDFADNGLFYVNYIDNSGDTVVAEFVADADGADSSSQRQLLRVEQPASNHNGGMIAFGPDGNLWIGLGDGGGANDQFGQGQRSDTLLGAMLRIGVGPEIDGYTIPDGNLQGEVWATGLRNPWRWAFDGDDLWIGDVGQGRIEEIDVVDSSAGNPNFGWSIMEGTECFGGGDCDRAGLVAPVYEYPHSEGCSVTGGVVYRGPAMPELSGQFLFADYCTGWIRSVGHDGVMREWLPAGTFSSVTSIAVDAQGEPLVITASGAIYALIRSE